MKKIRRVTRSHTNSLHNFFWMQRKIQAKNAGTAGYRSDSGSLRPRWMLLTFGLGIFLAFIVVGGLLQVGCSNGNATLAPYCPRMSAISKLGTVSTAANATVSALASRRSVANPIAVQISTRPRIFVVDNMITKEEANAIIEVARPHLERSRTGGAPSKKEGSVSEVRTSKGMFMVTQQQMALVAPIAERVARVAGIPADRFESMQVLRYGPGQQYRPHPDYFDGELLESVRGRGGNRVATIIMYLNDVGDGGETTFPMVNISVKPKTGGAVIFWSMNVDGTMEPRSLHSGRPVGEGREKWVSVYWMREQTVRA